MRFAFVGRVLLSASLVSLCFAAAQAQSVNVAARASANATVQAAGPRTGNNGVRFFNIEGSNNNAFASYGVLDFTASSFGIGFTVGDVSNLSLLLRDAPAAFSAGGNVNVYLATDTTTSIANTPGSSPLRFDATIPGGEGISAGAAGQLGTLYSMGVGAYAKGTQGDAFNYGLTLPAAAKTLFVNALNAGASGDVRLVVTPGAAGVAATYGGAASAIAALSDAPRLSFTATAVAASAAPEPGTFALLFAGGLLGLAIYRRSNRVA